MFRLLGIFVAILFISRLFLLTLSCYAQEDGQICWPEDVCKKNAEISKRALQAQNPNLCNQINQGTGTGDIGPDPVDDARVGCKVAVNLEIGGLDYCRSLDSSKFRSRRFSCLLDFAIKLKKPELCDELQDASGREDCRLMTNYRVEDCEKYKSFKFIDDPYNSRSPFAYSMCLRYVAENTNNQAICASITDKGQQDICQRHFRNHDIW
ncbi:MAG: hypothetical protein KGK03_09970 [Candidatus Omnitrophica bacterium]|nr:hypothetical protein [Candidatus Omnitrophota bacterium]MDE2223378.1 hypothetical protein [Candidatus Omnitrophota bacterium]